MDGDFVCPMCGTVVSASATECPDCGEAFSPVENPDAQPELEEETTVEETEELFVPDDSVTEEPELGICEACDGPLNEEGKCPSCQPVEQISRGSEGCPLCSSKTYTVESGDLVSCSECGNVYVKKMFEPVPQKWKLKFWVGLIFILIGNVGVALGSYVHNVIQWSPLGGMYLGYGSLDQITGVVGIVIFILGLILFAWSFKREREISCPSCKVVIRESDFEVYEPEEKEEVPQEIEIESALEEIGEAAECPSCGASVSIFDDSCPNCGAVFEMEIEFDDEPGETDVSEVTETEAPVFDESAPERFLTASEIDEDELIMDSLELEKPENGLDGNGISALDELETALEVSLDEGTVCDKCGARIGKGLDTCPGCGQELTGGE